MKIMELRLSCTLTMSGGGGAALARPVAIALGAAGDAAGMDAMLVRALPPSLSLAGAGAHSQTRSRTTDGLTRSLRFSWHGRICASRNYVLRAH